MTKTTPRRKRFSRAQRDRSLPWQESKAANGRLGTEDLEQEPRTNISDHKQETHGEWLESLNPQGLPEVTATSDKAILLSFPSSTTHWGSGIQMSETVGTSFQPLQGQTWRDTDVGTRHCAHNEASLLLGEAFKPLLFPRRNLAILWDFSQA